MARRGSDEEVSYLLAQADVVRLPLRDRSVDLVFGSPPYVDARLYLENGRDLGIARDCQQWVDWMLKVTTECLRVSRGAVLWVAAGVTRDRTYWPACEGLMWEWWKRGGSAYRPCYWHRVGIPGNGGDDWFRHDVEYCMCFKRNGGLPWSDNTAMGHPPIHGPGGRMSNRLVNGDRVRAFNVQTRRDRNGKRDSSNPMRPMPDLSNPGNLIDTGAGGGGNIGHALAHENEAPFPEDLAEWFIRSLCQPGGTVLDPFSGSGTTVSVCERLGRIGLGFDLRASQAKIAMQRIERPHAPVTRTGKVEHHPLFKDIDP